MTQISANILPFNINASSANTQKNKASDPASFEEIMTQATFKANANDFASQLLQSLMQSRGGSSASDAANDNAFPFSSAFESIFGSSGPLIDFINRVTTNLHLNAEQNQALQNIAINNKDITSVSPANVAKIAAELKQAGIG